MPSLFFFLRKKLILFILSLWIVATITFFLMHSIPGDPFTTEQALPKEILEAMKAHYGLNKPLFIQYVQYMKGLLTLSLGPSLKYQDRQVTDIIKEGFPISCYLGLGALSISLTLGLTLGAFSAIYRGRWQDKALMVFSVLGLSIPSFILATFLQYLFAMKLNLLPVARWGSFGHAILPVLSLAALPTAFIARLSRTSMIEVLGQDYIQTAKSKGLPIFLIITRHVLRNALLPVIAYLGPLSASILTGGFAVEKIFGIPGLGQCFVISISNRDYATIMGLTLFYSVFLLTAVLIMDIISSLLDPRIPLQKEQFS
ncbi:MAG: ABC transporter permease [Chlamydiota bacterium]